jgi:hypothetical protein
MPTFERLEGEARKKWLNQFVWKLSRNPLLYKVLYSLRDIETEKGFITRQEFYRYNKLGHRHGLTCWKIARQHMSLSHKSGRVKKWKLSHKAKLILYNLEN